MLTCMHACMHTYTQKAAAWKITVFTSSQFHLFWALNWTDKIVLHFITWINFALKENFTASCKCMKRHTFKPKWDLLLLLLFHEFHLLSKLSLLRLPRALHVLIEMLHLVVMLLQQLVRHRCRHRLCRCHFLFQLVLQNRESVTKSGEQPKELFFSKWVSSDRQKRSK